MFLTSERNHLYFLPTFKASLDGIINFPTYKKKSYKFKFQENTIYIYGTYLVC